MLERTVLVVDDETDIRESLQDALADEGYRVLVAADGRQALDLLPGITGPCAVILDIIMPVMSGAELYGLMQADPRFAGIPVLISTSDPSRAPRGPTVLRKPISLSRLLSTLAGLFPASSAPLSDRRDG